MKTIQLSSWEEWEKISLELINNLKKIKSKKNSLFSEIIFRGHSCESWELDTTLERYLDKQISIEEYHRYLLAVQPAFETFIEKKWELENNPSITDMPQPPPGYEFMLYLRHHGFPTPLLDWTRSPYVAAFFAFQNSGSEDNVAIFTFVEYAGRAKSGWVGEATICGCGPYVSTHKRHFQQQGEYTICKKQQDNKWYYCKHNEAFSRNNTKQDVLTKYLIPSKDKYKALSKLDLMNINAFSLFGNTEGLAEMLAYREIMKRNL